MAEAYCIPMLVLLHKILVLGLFLTFEALTGYFCGQGRVQKLFLGLLIYTNNFFFLVWLNSYSILEFVW